MAIDSGGGNGGNGGGNDGGGNGNNGGGNASDTQQRLQAALEDANAAYDAGQQALAQGDFAAYGEAQDDLLAALQRAEAAANELGLNEIPAIPAPEGGSASSAVP